MDFLVVLLQVHEGADERLVKFLKGTLAYICEGLVSVVERDTVEHSYIVMFRLRRGVIADKEAACPERLRQKPLRQPERQLLRQEGTRLQHS